MQKFVEQNSVIARRRLFSTAHRYEQKAWTPEKNREVFGACYSPHGHGHNYVLEIFVSGPIDEQTGLVVNVTDLDVILRDVTAAFDHHHISFDVPEFRDIVPTTENLVNYLSSQIRTQLRINQPKLTLNRVRLFETEDLWAEAREILPVAAPPPAQSFEFTQQLTIRSIHHLENKKWDAAQNKSVYGICYGTHGHHYKIQVTVRGALDPRTNLVADRVRLPRLLESAVRVPYDGVDLNKIFSNTSCEALAVEFYTILQPLIRQELYGAELVRIGIQETRKNFFEFPASLG